MHKIEIEKIVNGYILTTQYDRYLKTFHKDMTSVIAHMQSVWGAVEKELNKEKTNGSSS